jgi:pimeloyl-ACP methyl ester carboxylesterase
MTERVRERFVEANSLSHHVLEWGDPNAAQSIVMCHGFLDLGWGFSLLAAPLAKAGYRVIAFDFRGHGESEWIGRGGYYHFVDYVLDLHALVPQLGAERIHLLGHSMGGTVATLYAGSHPERIRSLTLLEGYGPPTLDTGPVERMLGWISDVERVWAEHEPSPLPDLAAAVDRLRKRNPSLSDSFLLGLAQRATKPHPREGLMWRFDPLHRSRSPLGFERERFKAFAQRIEAPTLLIQGERGMRTGDDEARIASYPNARSLQIAQAGHMLQWTHADRVAELMLPFLTST